MTNTTEALAVVERQETGIESIKALQGRMTFEAARIAEMKKFVKAHMKEGIDFGVIPGTKDGKPSLWKPGAEIMCGIYRYEPEYVIAEAYEPERVKEWTKKRRDGGTWGGKATGRYEVMATCTLRHITTGNVVGQGVGSCNSWEAKYVSVDVDDTKNTVLKMAQKRAYVAATLSACRLSAFFTQDMEDMAHDEEPEEPAQYRRATPAAAPSPAPEVNLGEGEAAEGQPDNVVIGDVEEVEFDAKTGTSKQGKWTLHIVTVKDERFGTYSKSRAEVADKAKGDRVPVRIIWALDKGGRKEIADISRAF